jgi:hypothetical protein
MNGSTHHRAGFWPARSEKPQVVLDIHEKANILYSLHVISESRRQAQESVGSSVSCIEISIVAEVQANAKSINAAS